MSSPITAKRETINSDHISQGDIFKDIEVIESVVIRESEIIVSKLFLPYVICLNQQCDIDKDYYEYNKNSGEAESNNSILHFIIAPLLNMSAISNDPGPWGNIFKNADFSNIKNPKKLDSFKKNQIDRYHYINFGDKNNGEDVGIPDMFIDFKHFFTVSRGTLYQEKKLLEKISIATPFRERILQRFSFYISRIGLPPV